MAPVSKHFRKRDAILDCLRHSRAHPSAEMIYARLKPTIPNLSMGTVYRNLAVFQQQGLIRCVATVRGAERYDGRTEDHVHFLCTRCGNVSDLDDVPVPPQLCRAASRCGNRVESASLIFSGVCQSCVRSGESLSK